MPQEELGELVARAKEQARRLVRQELELARTEARPSVLHARTAVVLLGASAVLGYSSFLVLCVAMAYGIRAGSGAPLDVAFMAVGMFFLFVSGGAGTFGLLGLLRMRGPRRTKKTLRDTLAWLRHPRYAPDPHLEELRASHRTRGVT